MEFVAEDKPIISIIIPTFNRERQLGIVVQSLQLQSESNWECIVVDDGSTDNTTELITKISTQDHRIKYTKRNREPKGAPTCRNIGASLASSTHLLFFDSDDLFFPWAIETIANQLNNSPESDMYIYQQLVYHVHASKHFWWRTIDTSKEDYLKRIVSFDFSLSTHSVIWKKDYFKKLDQWDEGLNAWQDPPLHIKAMIDDCSIQWIGNSPLAIIVQQQNSDQISAKARTANFSESLALAMDRLTLDYRNQFKKFIFDKVWVEAAFYPNFQELNNDLNQLANYQLVDKNSLAKLRRYFYFYFAIKRIPILYSLYYRLYKERNQRKFYNKMFPSNEEFREVINRMDSNPAFKQFLNSKYSNFLEQLHEQNHQ